MKITKRLVAVLFMSLVFACAAYGVEITDFSQITDMNGTYELVSDVIIPSDFSYVGTESAPFTGSFDGKGHKVTGSYSSIFGYTDGAKIKNIKSEASLVSDTYFGGIVAVAEGKTVIEGCTFSGNVTVDNGGMYSIGGGIVGLAGDKATVQNCNADVTLSVTDKPYVLTFGGIAGENRGDVLYCRSFGSIVSNSDKYKINLGGIIGENSGKTEGCANFAETGGRVTIEAATLLTGGIVGFNNEGSIVRAVNFGKISGKGNSIYPAYLGGIVGMNQNGTVENAKNEAVVNAVRAFAGGIAGFNLGNKDASSVCDVLNEGVVLKIDSVAGGITAVSAVTDHKEGAASVKYALNYSSDKAIAQNGADTSEIYNMGEADGVSTAVTADSLKKNGIPALEAHKNIWVNNTEISALPDILITGDDSKAQIIASNIGDSGDMAYYLYSPDSSGYAKAFTAVYYNGSRYISMDYIEKVPTETYARLKASDIPEGTTRIKFIAFAETFGTAFKPAEVISAEISYTK